MYEYQRAVRAGGLLRHQRHKCRSQFGLIGATPEVVVIGRRNQLAHQYAAPVRSARCATKEHDTSLGRSTQHRMLDVRQTEAVMTRSSTIVPDTTVV